VSENRFYDFSTGQGGNAITLARLHHKDPQMPFQTAFEWLKRLPRRLNKPTEWWHPNERKTSQTMLPTRSDGLLGNLDPSGVSPSFKTQRNEGRSRLAWLIVRQQFAGVSIPCLNLRGVVALIAQALGRQFEKAAIEEAIQAAIASYKTAAPGFAARSKFYKNTYRDVAWRHRDLRNASEPEHYEDLFGMAHFLKALRRNLDHAYEPPKVSASVERNTDTAAIEMCRTQIKAMFFPNEYVWITNGLRHRGWCRTAEYWLADIKNNGVPTGENGAWIKQNPLSKFGTGNGEVRAFRHALCEADGLSLQEQCDLAETLPYPIVSAVHSGGKSIHYLLRVDATKETYTELVKRLHEQFPVFDSACKDPARWTRLAGAKRAGVLQAALPTPASGHRSPGREP